MQREEHLLVDLGQDIKELSGGVSPLVRLAQFQFDASLHKVEISTSTVKAKEM